MKIFNEEELNVGMRYKSHDGKMYLICFNSQVTCLDNSKVIKKDNQLIYAEIKEIYDKDGVIVAHRKSKYGKLIYYNMLTENEDLKYIKRMNILFTIEEIEKQIFEAIKFIDVRGLVFYQTKPVKLKTSKGIDAGFKQSYVVIEYENELIELRRIEVAEDLFLYRMTIVSNIFAEHRGDVI